MLKVLVLLAIFSVALGNVPAAASDGTSLQRGEGSEAYMFHNYDLHPASVSYPYITYAQWDGKDMTQWLQSYFMTNNVNGRLPNNHLPFTAPPYTITSGSVHYDIRRTYYTSKFNDFQPVNFPEVACSTLPVIKKVLYGVPGHDIDMTEWFKNYFIQHQVNGKLTNHLIYFHHVYGDPRPNVQKQFKITYYIPRASTLWLAPPLRISEYGHTTYPQFSIAGGMNPVVIDAKYGAGSHWAPQVRDKFTRWVCQAPRNGRFHGNSPGWHTLFGDPIYGVHKTMTIYYAQQLDFVYDISDDVIGITTHQAGEHDHVVFPPSHLEAFPVILAVQYGTDSHKIDVTAKFLKFYIEHAKDTGRVNGRYHWNAYFGDPVPNVVKKLFFQFGYPKKTVANSLSLDVEEYVQPNVEEEDVDAEFDLEN